MHTPREATARHPRVLGLASLGLVAAAVAVCAAAYVAAYAGVSAGTPWFDGSLHGASPPRWLTISLVVFLAATVSSIVGFAFSAIAGAVLLHYVPDGVRAVQIMMIASIGIQAYSVAGLARSIRWSRCAPFLAGGLATLPVGVFLLLNLQPRYYVLAMGAALVAYGLWMLLRRPGAGKRVSGRFADALVGAVGGITGPLAAMPGAYVAIRCARRDWSKVEQRAVYQPYILVMQLAAIAALFLLQPRASFDPALFGYAVPGMAGAVVGLRIFHALDEAQFQRVLNLALVVSGGALLLK